MQLSESVNYRFIHWRVSNRVRVCCIREMKGILFDNNYSVFYVSSNHLRFFFLYYFVLNDSNYSCNLIDKSKILEYQLLNIIQTNEACVYIIYILFQVWNQRISPSYHSYLTRKVKSVAREIWQHQYPLT